MLESKKEYGKFEKPLIKRVCSFFKSEGYDVIPHARFNISWGCILSDLDVLLMRKNELTLVEVKSSRDNMSRAMHQIENKIDYVDFAYLATESFSPRFNTGKVGVILIDEASITISKVAMSLNNNPRLESVLAIQKKCMARLAGLENGAAFSRLTKNELAEYLYNTFEGHALKTELKGIVTCDLNCEENCPILRDGIDSRNTNCDIHR